MTAPTLPDSWALVARAQAGDVDAVSALYRNYQPTLYRFVYRRVTRTHTAEDICSDTWVRAIKHIGTVSYQGSDVGAWLLRIARNLVADYYKSGRYRLELPTGEVLDADRPAVDDPSESAANTLESRALMAAMARLNDEQRQVVELRYLRGYSTPETAAVMGKNEGAVKALLYRAVRSLARDESVQALAVTP